MAKELWKGNEAIAEAAIRGGCDCYFGYPITPQSEVPEYMSLHMPEHGKVFVQAESELAAINMVYGAAASGMRAMTSSSSPGVALKQEGISYIATCELPCVIVNCMRGGPGLGTIQPSQSDYFQATRGGGNGDYRTVVLAPANIQELVDFIQEAFDIADCYRNPVLVLADGLTGQMMEPIEWHEIPHRELPPKDWATTGKHGRSHPNFVTSLFIDPNDCDEMNQRLAKKYALIPRGGAATKPKTATTPRASSWPTAPPPVWCSPPSRSCASRASRPAFSAPSPSGPSPRSSCMTWPARTM